MTHILGVSCYYHDAAAAILHDGELVAAAEEERFSRRKHDQSFPKHAIEFCLSRAGIEGPELDLVVFYENPYLKFERILLTTLGEYPWAARPFAAAMRGWLKEKLWIRGRLATHLGVPLSRVEFVEHHLSHAASAFFASPYEEAAILTADGVGEWTTTATGSGRADFGRWPNSLALTQEIRFPHSLGLLYSAFTGYLGFEVNEGEYKVMGMAPFGVPRYEEEVRRVIRIADDGSFELDLGYFSFTRSLEHTFGHRFVELFGPPRPAERDFRTVAMGAADDARARDDQRYADIAASVQVVVEDVLLRAARSVRSTAPRLAMAGGVALNAVANGRLEREAGFDEIWIQPAAGDSGGSLGAALYAHHVGRAGPRTWTMEHVYWGQDHADAEIAAALTEAGLDAEQLADDATLVDRVSELLAAGNVIGWFQGRFEWGPRALGHRSILADPRNAAMKERVNAMIKFREPFRPFAPVVAAEDAPAIFDLGARGVTPLATFMLTVVPIRPGYVERIPAVSHMGTARLQAVRRDVDPLYHALVRAFGARTGIGVLMNTSFNLRGEPMVASPRDAISTFQRSGLDALVLHHFLVRK